MSLTSTRLAAPPLPGSVPVASGGPRVRQQARDAVALMAFSAASSVGVAGGLLLLAQLGR
ncbi:hypothetical protein [Nocardioides cynanchi]|uniref:hypothetical protein n=1 Tax=Nocardioides cynanchi TaxID=2558918 RepID=UPI0012442B55|nr:hypothetical protein [Nocardioides cynanchi]